MLAGDVSLFGEASFGAQASSEAKAIAIMRKRYPALRAIVARWVARILPCRLPLSHRRPSPRNGRSSYTFCILGGGTGTSRNSLKSGKMFSSRSCAKGRARVALLLLISERRAGGQWNFAPTMLLMWLIHFAHLTNTSAFIALSMFDQIGPSQGAGVAL